MKQLSMKYSSPFSHLPPHPQVLLLQCNKLLFFFQYIFSCALVLRSYYLFLVGHFINCLFTFVFVVEDLVFIHHHFHSISSILSINVFHDFELYQQLALHYYNCVAAIIYLRANLCIMTVFPFSYKFFFFLQLIFASFFHLFTFLCLSLFFSNISTDLSST